MNVELPSYVLITPARNEAQFIELTLQSVIAQTLRPLRWVIVSDGSTDGTDEIVGRYLPGHPWIELLRMPERRERHFAGKAVAFNAGCARVADLAYDLIGNLDADLSFDAGLYRCLVGKINADPRLGVVGAALREGGSQYDYRFTSEEHVSGACQLFRRACLEGIGGYRPIEGGGIDLVAVVTARMNGWKTRTCPEVACIHHRKMNTAVNNGLRLEFEWGRKEYRLGNHPVWQIFRCVYKMRKPPYVIGGALTLAGYFRSFAARHPRPVSPEFTEFRRKEQMCRLKEFTARLCGLNSTSGSRAAASRGV